VTLDSVSDVFVLSEADAEPPEEPQDDSFTRHNSLHENCMAELFPAIYLDIYMGHDTELDDLISTSIALPTSPEVQHRIDMLISLLISQYKLNPKQFPLASTVFTSDNICHK
jgi:hypothetical protein